MMKRLYTSGAVPNIDPNGAVDIVSQVYDSMIGIQSNISNIIVEYNAEVYPILSTLPQGKSEVRWNMTTDDINAQKNGLDGANLFVHNSATSVSDGGRFWYPSSSGSRPKTVKEVLSDLYTELNTTADELRVEFSATTSGISDTAKGRIGANIFDATQSSSSSSLDGVTASNQNNALQLARDLYDDTNDSWTGDGTTLLTYSFRDHVEALIDLHEGVWDSSLDLYHSFEIALGSGYTYTAGVTPTEETFGEDSFDGSTIGEGTAYLTAAMTPTFDTTGTSEVRLYDVGPKAGPATLPGRLVATLSTSTASGPQIVEQALTVVTSGASTNEILNTDRIYAVRAYTDVASDAVYVGSAKIKVR